MQTLPQRIPLGRRPLQVVRALPEARQPRARKRVLARQVKGIDLLLLNFCHLPAQRPRDPVLGRVGVEVVAAVVDERGRVREALHGRGEEGALACVERVVRVDHVRERRVGLLELREIAGSFARDEL